MPTLDKYAPYILSAYAVAIVALVGLVAWTAWRAISAKKKLDTRNTLPATSISITSPTASIPSHRTTVSFLR